MNGIKILFFLIIPAFNVYGQSIGWKKLNENIYYSLIKNNSNEKVGIKDLVKVDILLKESEYIFKIKTIGKTAISFHLLKI